MKNKKSTELLNKILALAIFSIAMILLFKYPLHRFVLIFIFIGYGFLLWRFPKAWLFAVPAVLPILDFIDWTGWSLIDEFDIFLMITLGVLLWKKEFGKIIKQHRWVNWLVVCYGLVFLIGFSRGFFPIQAFNANAQFSYLSNYHALRVGKSVIWAFIFLPFLRYALQDKSKIKNLFIPGLLTGLAATGLAILWEKHIFTGLFNFAIDYRAAAFFSSMNTGGGSIDGYLALTVPFVAACFLLWKNRTAYYFGLLLLGIGVYSLLATFTRINYLAILIAGMVIFIGLLRAKMPKKKLYAAIVPSTILTVIILVLVLLGPIMQNRFADTADDARFRVNSVKSDLMLMDKNWHTILFGQGLGSFPRIRSLKTTDKESPASFTFLDEDGNTFLQLKAGTPNYFMQRLSKPLPNQIKVKSNIRAYEEGAAVSIIICEKALLYSFVCVSDRITDTNIGQWSKVETNLDLTKLNKKFQPVYFSISPSGKIDIDELVVVDSQGKEILTN
jgi:hypothetical protein